MRQMLLATNGRIFRVRFVKRSTGKVRNMSARSGVRKGLKDPDGPLDPKLVQQDIDNDLLRVWDVEKNGYRCIALESIEYIKCGEIEWRRDEEDEDVSFIGDDEE